MPAIKKRLLPVLTLCKESFLLVPLAIVGVLFSSIVVFPFAFSLTLLDVLGGSSSFPADATHVPTFYVPKHQSSKHYHILLLMVLGVVFGSIHFVAWNHPFPTEQERQIWQRATIIVTAYPVIAPLRLFKLKEGRKSRAASMCLLALGRLVILGLAVVLLRHQPRSAFIDVDWSKFYPHVF